MTGRTGLPPAPAHDRADVDAPARAAVPALAAEGTGGGFRPEVHVLRALAVTLVLIYHLVPAALPGGYVGVDVFFVISGFLITGLMLREVERTGRLSLRDFYARRARRILPAATTVIVAVCAAGLVLLPPSRWVELGAHASRSALFLENWFLAGQSVDYLAEGMAPSPFQHFWSLSIEEQVYLVWPGAIALVAVIVAGRVSTRRVAAALAAVLVAASLAVSVSMTVTGDPAAYFVTTTRVWELAAGALLACAAPWLGRRIGRLGRVLLPALGLATIVAAAVLLDDATPYPGAVALAPVLGALVVIVGGCGRPTLGIVAANPVVRWLGEVSYSLYLWHWPVIVLTAAVAPQAAASVTVAAALLASLALAHLSRALVERPFLTGRLRGIAPRRALAAGLVLILAGAGAGAVVTGVANAQQRATDAAVAELLAAPPASLGAGSLDGDGYEAFASDAPSGVIVPDPTNARAELPLSSDPGCKAVRESPATPQCRFGSTQNPTATIALVGDSHAEHYLPALRLLAREHGWQIVTYLHSSCPFSMAQPAADVARGNACLSANAQTGPALLELAPDLVITSNRTTVQFVDSEQVPGPVEGFQQAWAPLTGAGIGVLVIRDNPLMLADDATTDCVASSPGQPERCELPREEALQPDLQTEAAQQQAGVDVLDLTDRYCTGQTCPAVIGSVLVYMDSQHITPEYMRTLAPDLEAVITSLLQ